MKKSVTIGKFFPQDKIKDNIEAIIKAFLIGPFKIIIANTAKKNTTIPIYAGASRIGWEPQ